MKILIRISSRGRVSNLIAVVRRRRPNESQNKNSSYTKCNSRLGGQMKGCRSSKLLVCSAEKCLWSRINQKLANGMKMWKEISNTTTLFFSLKELGMMILLKIFLLHQEGRGQVNASLFYKFKDLLTSSILISQLNHIFKLIKPSTLGILIINR